MSALSPQVLSNLEANIAVANADISQRYPIDSGKRQPVHTVYGGAHLFKAELAQKLGKVALKNLDTYCGDASEWAESVGLKARGEAAAMILERVRSKLASEPIEDFRIDFEDGYGNRPDEEEDAHAVQAAEQTAKGMELGSLPPFIGIRIKPLSEELHKRSLRTLDLYLSTLVNKAGAKLPDNFVVTLPKITTPAHVVALCDAFGAIEESLGLANGSLKIEMMVETPQSIIDHHGHCPLPGMAEAAGGRCTGAHFGTYDYTALVGITAAYQTHSHSACDFARHTMQVAFAGTGILMSDGATTTMPVPVHRAKKDGPALTDAQFADNRKSVHDAWRLHVSDVQHSLSHGVYQSWDLHPAQLVTRYATFYDFFLDGLPAASNRLKNFVKAAAQATLIGDMFDDAATGQGLLNFFLLGIGCGAFPEDEVLKAGLTLDELHSRSFVKIVANRGSGSPE